MQPLLLKSKLSRHFQLIKTLQARDGQKNDVSVISKNTKSGKNGTWYSKFLSHPDYIAISLFSGEITRLLGNTATTAYPKIRVLARTNSTTGEGRLAISSKEIAGFSEVTIGTIKAYEANPSNYKGFGIAVTLAYILGEADAKLGNFALATGNQFYKTDFDFSMPTAHDRISMQQTLKTTFEKLERVCSEDIEALPLLSPNGFQPYNWLDIIIENKHIYHPVIQDLEKRLATVGNNPDFRREVNRTLLKFILLPKELLYSFLNLYLANSLPPDKCNIVEIEKLIAKYKSVSVYSEQAYTQKEMTLRILNSLKFLDERQNKIKAAALGSKKFIAYLKNPASAIDLADIKTEILSMQAMQKESIVSAERKEVINYQLQANYDAILKQVTPQEEPLPEKHVKALEISPKPQEKSLSTKSGEALVQPPKPQEQLEIEKPRALVQLLQTQSQIHLQAQQSHITELKQRLQTHIAELKQRSHFAKLFNSPIKEVNVATILLCNLEKLIKKTKLPEEIFSKENLKILEQGKLGKIYFNLGLKEKTETEKLGTLRILS